MGCASIVSRDTRPITINSNPNSATVLIKDEKGRDIQHGTTPMTVDLPVSAGYMDGKNYVITISKEGFQTQTVKVTSSINGWYWGNILFGGLIGWLIVDPLTGKMWTLEPQQVDAALGPKVSSAKGKIGLTVALLQDVPQNLHAHMIPLLNPTH